MSSDVDGDESVVVVDCGSGSVIAGYAGDDAPRSVIRNLVGTPRHEVFSKEILNPKHFVGEVAERERSLMTLSYPMERGIVTNWDNMEKVFHHTFYSDLRLDPEEHTVLLTEPPMNPKANREKMAELMFETFKAQGLHISLQPTLSLYASGRHTGVVVEVGEGVTHVTPLKGVYGWPQAIKRSHLAGIDLTNYLAKLLTERGHYFHSTVEMEIVRDMKEKLAYVAEDFDAEMKKSTSESTYELPDGTKITIGDEMFRCAEPLFNPTLLDMDQPGLSEMIYKSIMAIDIDARRDIYINIILSGGSTMFPGMAERIKREVATMAPPSVKINVVQHDCRKYNVWIGGSILGSLTSFKKIVIPRKEYDEIGPSVIHKCI